MVCREIWEKARTREFFKNTQILYVFEVLTRACCSQIALETILLPILISMFSILSISLLNYCNTLEKNTNRSEGNIDDVDTVSSEQAGSVKTDTRGL